ncbi:MAG: GNAT family N-acetyltransferase, partial [Stackebrandtia sp.]
MNTEITTLDQRPELAGAIWSMPDTWPEYIGEDRIGWLFYPRIPDDFPRYVIVATEDDTLVAVGFGVPFAGTVKGREELPSGGWDQALMWAHSDLRHNRETDTVSAISITVHTDHLGKGLSKRMVAAMCDNAKAQGATQMVAPLRPTGKHL